MLVLLWVVIGALGGTLLAVSVWGLVVGSVTVLSDQGLTPCPRCSGYDLALHSPVHSYGCPSEAADLCLRVPGLGCTSLAPATIETASGRPVVLSSGSYVSK